MPDDSATTNGEGPLAESQDDAETTCTSCDSPNPHDAVPGTSAAS